jgi:predicted nucleic acid-binding protein
VEAGADLPPVSLRIFLVRRSLLEEVPLDVEDRIQTLEIAGELSNLSGELDVIDHLKAANARAGDSLLRAL